jgi:hypothetical protein
VLKSDPAAHVLLLSKNAMTGKYHDSWHMMVNDMMCQTKEYYNDFINNVEWVQSLSPSEGMSGKT